MPNIKELRAAIRSIESGDGGAFENEPVALEEPTCKPDDETSRAFAKIADMLSRSERSTKEVRERLKCKGFGETAIEEALSRACRCGLVDDSRYAEWLVRSRLRQGRGLSGIERELSEIGFTLADVRGWPEEFDYDEDQEVERALGFLAMHPPRSKNAWQGAYRKLMTKGFSSSAASAAARRWSAQE